MEDAVIFISSTVSERSFHQAPSRRLLLALQKRVHAATQGGTGPSSRQEDCTSSSSDATFCAQWSLETKGSWKDMLPLKSPNRCACESLSKEPDETVNGNLTPLPASGVDVKMSNDCNPALLNSVLIESYVSDPCLAGLCPSPSFRRAWIYADAHMKSSTTSHKYAQVSVCLYNKYYQDHKEIKMELEDGCPLLIYPT